MSKKFLQNIVFTFALIVGIEGLSNLAVASDTCEYREMQKNCLKPGLKRCLFLETTAAHLYCMKIYQKSGYSTYKDPCYFGCLEDQRHNACPNSKSRCDHSLD